MTTRLKPRVHLKYIHLGTCTVMYAIIERNGEQTMRPVYWQVVTP